MWFLNLRLFAKRCWKPTNRAPSPVTPPAPEVRLGVGVVLARAPRRHFLPRNPPDQPHLHRFHDREPPIARGGMAGLARGHQECSQDLKRNPAQRHIYGSPRSPHRGPTARWHDGDAHRSALLIGWRAGGGLQDKEGSEAGASEDEGGHGK